jgi:hypothetical protein
MPRGFVYLNEKSKSGNEGTVQCVHSDEIEVLPDLSEQLVKVPLEMRRDWHPVRQLIKNVELLERDLIDLVQHVDARNVHAIALDDVDQLVDARVAPQADIGVVDLVLGADGLDGLKVEFGRGDSVSEVEASLLLPPERNVRWLFVETNSEALEFALWGASQKELIT